MFIFQQDNAPAHHAYNMHACTGCSGVSYTYAHAGDTYINAGIPSSSARTYMWPCTSYTCHLILIRLIKRSGLYMQGSRQRFMISVNSENSRQSLDTSYSIPQSVVDITTVDQWQLQEPSCVTVLGPYAVEDISSISCRLTHVTILIYGSHSERIFKIGQYLLKLRRLKCNVLFFLLDHYMYSVYSIIHEEVMWYASFR